MILEAENIGAGGMPGSPISPLVVEFTQETESRLHVKIADPSKQRWEIPERCTLIVGVITAYFGSRGVGPFREKV